MVEVRESRSGETRIIAACSCPVGFACKHAVALIVAVRDSIEPYEEPDAQPYVPAVRHEPWSRPAPRPVEPLWKQTLGPLARTGDGPASVEWALKIELTGGGAYGISFLSARPMKRGVKTDTIEEKVMELKAQGGAVRRGDGRGRGAVGCADG